jgi:L-methionine (R)-S-oxide reductase
MTDLDIKRILHGVKNITCCKQDRDKTLLDISSFLKDSVFHYDWVGFYLINERLDGLNLGPYAGSSTEHTSIPLGKGICGQVAQRKEMMIVQDVSQVENYLSCSINVQSEIVVPILKDGVFVAELDIDSHSPAPFSNNDKLLLEEICAEISAFF